MKVVSPLGSAVAFVEVRSGSERDLMYTISGATAHLALRAVRALPANPDRSDDYSPSATEVLGSDLANDNTSKAIFYTPVASSSISTTAFVTVDVVEASGTVVLHRNLAGGVARKAFGGGLETWTPEPGGRAIHDIIQFRQGAWRLAVSAPVGSDTIPVNTGAF